MQPLESVRDKFQPLEPTDTFISSTTSSYYMMSEISLPYDGTFRYLMQTAKEKVQWWLKWVHEVVTWVNTMLRGQPVFNFQCLA